MLRAPLLGRSGIASAAASRAALRCRCSASSNGDGATPVQRGSLRPGTAVHARAIPFWVSTNEPDTAGYARHLYTLNTDEKYTCAWVPRARPSAATAASVNVCASLQDTSAGKSIRAQAPRARRPARAPHPCPWTRMPALLPRPRPARRASSRRCAPAAPRGWASASQRAACCAPQALPSCSPLSAHALSSCGPRLVTLCPAAASVCSRLVQQQDLSVHAQSRACSRVRAGISWKRSCTMSARAACSPSYTAVSGCLC